MAYSEASVRYSKALFNLGSSLQDQERRQGDLQRFADDFSRKPEIKSFFLSPKIPLREKKEVLEKGLKKTNDSELINFLKFLLDKNQFKLIPEIAFEYTKLTNEKAGKLEAYLTCALELESSTEDVLKKILEKMFKKQIHLNITIDPKLIAGGIILVNNQLLDFSIKGRLESLREDLLSVNVYPRSKA